MEACGYLRKEYARDNRKTAHLRICDAAEQIVADGQAAQKRFFSIMLQGMTQEEMDGMKRCMDYIFNNINRYLKDGGWNMADDQTDHESRESGMAE